MAGSTVTSPIKETDVTVLKETLRSQQKLLQKLYAELDVEREAASTATNEALSMIRKLQGEKSAMKMEASQYKRMAEERISHAEETLEMYEELMYQKEMEISTLEFQIEAYKYKLLSMGCEDLDDIENPFAERNDSPFGEKGTKAHMRRLSSLPSLLSTDVSKMKSSGDGEKRLMKLPEVSSSIDAEKLESIVRDRDSCRSSPRSMEFISYWEQIQALDEKVKEISACKEVGKKKLANIKVKPAGSTSPTKGKLPPKCQRIKTREDSSEKATPNSANSPLTIHDVFEVHCKFEDPESSRKSESAKNKGKLLVEEDSRLKKPDTFMIGSPADADDELDWFSKDDFLSVKPGKKGHKLRDEMNPDPDYESPVEYDTDLIKMNKLLGGNNEKRPCKPSDETNDDCRSALLHPSTRVTDNRSERQRLAQRVDRLEGRGHKRIHEISEGREDELNLLIQLREQLNSIQSEMRSWRPKKSPADEVSLVPLIQAMLPFWL